jgi:hypothetical protein
MGKRDRDAEHDGKHRKKGKKHRHREKKHKKSAEGYCSSTVSHTQAFPPSTLATPD